MTRRPTDIVVACCRDEADIIAPFIDFYLDAGFDWVCLIDNGSTDDTVRRIRNHARGDRVRLHQDPRPGYDMRLVEYLRVFEHMASRWVFFVDLDEFVPVPDGIKQFAARLPWDVTVLELPTAEMLPDPSALPLLATRREARRHNEIKVVWKAGVAASVSCGKHAIEGDRIVRHRDDRLLIRHFHTRSQHQFRQKLRNRLQTEAAIRGTPGAADRLSAFSSEQRAAWVAESRALLEADGWEREMARLAATPWIEDTVIHDWYRGRAAREGA
jgi:glycosyltransferase involved in cell wall biosynthesis